MEARHYMISVNSTPERLLRVGPLIPGAWSHPHGNVTSGVINGDILLDTGAFGAMIDVEVAESLRLPIQGAQEVHGIHGYGTLYRYRAMLSLPAYGRDGQEDTYTSVIECMGVPSLFEKNQQHGVHVIGIVGRIFLQVAQLEIDGVSGKFKLLIRDAAKVGASLLD